MTAADDRSRAGAPTTRRYYVLAVSFVFTMLVGVGIGMAITAQTPSGFPTVIEPGSMAKGASFVILKDGATTYAVNGTTGAVAYSGASSNAVIQSAIDAVSNGGTIFLKQATYTVTTGLVVNHSYLVLTADPGTVVAGSVLPIFKIEGTEIDPPDEFDSLGGFKVSNIQFHYTGAEAPRAAVQIYNVSTSHPLSLMLDNLIIRSDVDGPTDLNFVGMALLNVIGIQVQSVSFIKWGVGITHDTTLFSDPPEYYNDDGNRFVRVYMEYVYDGVIYKSNGQSGITVCDDWQNLKMHYVTEYGVFGSVWAAPTEVRFSSFHIEGLGLNYDGPNVPTAIKLWSRNVIIENSAFVGNVALNPLRAIHADGTGAWLIQNNYFNNYNYPIKGWNESRFILVGNIYEGSIVTKVDQAYWKVQTIYDGYAASNNGRLSVTGAVDYVTVTHGLDWPTVILVTSEQNGTGAVWVSDRGATTFRINFAVQPGGSTWYFDWYAYFYSTT